MDKLISKPQHELSTVVEKVREYISNSKADNTKRAYRADWKHFNNWCQEHGYLSLPAQPEVICMYLTTLAATRKVSTIQRRLTSIGQAHQSAGFESPTSHIGVRNLMRGIRREKGSMQVGKAPILTEHLREMISSLPKTIAGIRDKALLLLGFYGAFRRSEVTGLDVENVSFEKEGLVVTLLRSKTDQEGQGIKKGIPNGIHDKTCPVLALLDWLTQAGISKGAIFRGIDRHGKISEKRLAGKAVSLIIKRIAKRVGLDPAKFAGHSLRSGFATVASNAGATELEIMNQTGHKSLTVLRRYIRNGSLFKNNACRRVGL